MQNSAKSMQQKAPSRCSLCGSEGTNKSTCPWNEFATTVNPEKHYQAAGPSSWGGNWNPGMWEKPNIPYGQQNGGRVISQQYGGLSWPFNKQSKKGQVISGPTNVQKGKLTTDPFLQSVTNTDIMMDILQLNNESEMLKAEVQRAVQNKDYAKVDQYMSRVEDIAKRRNKLEKEAQAAKRFTE